METSDRETSELALCVINDPASYSLRIKKYQELSPEEYKAWMKGLVTAQANLQYRLFKSRFRLKDITLAVDEVIEHMQNHVKEL
jgi:hypothetical protein